MDNRHHSQLNAAARLSLEAVARHAGGEAAERAARAAARCRDPARALWAFERLASAAPSTFPHDEAALRLLGVLATASNHFPRLIARRPRLLGWASASSRAARTAGDVRRRLSAVVAGLDPGDLDGLMRAVRRVRARELLRVAARELDGVALPTTAGEIAAVAEACLAVAIPFLDAGLRRRFGAPEGSERPGDGFCAIGMGKLGGAELNFSSDIDVLLVYARDGHTRGGCDGGDAASGLTHLEYYARLAAQLVRALGEATEDGFAFRVDLNLRPDGRSGPLVNTPESLEWYYASFGRTWERAALLKARPVAGDLALGERALRALDPFVWRRSVDFAAVEGLRAIKAQIDARAGARGDDDVKLGPGGIREIEFFIQALQLLHGGRDPRLRERGTLRALSNALVAGLLSPRDHDALAEAYVFLRLVEHRLQMVDDRQTQRLPAGDEPAWLRLAHALDLPDAASLRAALERHRGAVAAIFGDILRASGAAPPAPDPVLEAAVDPDGAEPERLAALADRGFRTPAEALQSLRRLARVPSSPFARRGGADPAAVQLLGDCAASPDPDLALFHLGEFVTGLRTSRSWFALLEAHRATARLLATLFGTSDFLSKYLLRHPELLDALLRSGGGAEPRRGAAAAASAAERIARELAERLAAHEADPEGQLVAMRRFKNEEVLRVGLEDIAGNLDTDAVGEELTALADGLIGACLELAAAELRARFGAPRGERDGGAPAGLAVLGLGKLGGRELGYHSDLDLVFLYSEPGETSGGARGRCSNAEFFARLAQRLLSNLSLQLREGYLYRADVRLRPSGSQGALVVSVPSFADYQRSRAQPWERQALVKARFVAGDARLFERVRDEVLVPQVFLAPVADPAALARAMARMRERMERELAHESRAQYNPKLGRGGLVDVEFVTQYLQLLHGGRYPEVRATGTRAALAALAACGALETERAAFLREAWLFLRRVENRLRIVHDHPLQHLPRGGAALAALARRLGYTGGADAAGERFLREYEALTARVRDAYDAVFLAGQP